MRTEPRNPLYLLLLVVGLLFVITALAVAIIPVLEQKALEQGTAPPPSALRDALRRDGWKWLLWEVAALVVLGVASMALDHRRSLQKGEEEGTIPDEKPSAGPP